LKIYFTCIAGIESFILGNKINEVKELKDIEKFSVKRLRKKCQGLLKKL
jgi:hypothetical protein